MAASDDAQERLIAFLLRDLARLEAIHAHLLDALDQANHVEQFHMRLVALAPMLRRAIAQVREVYDTAAGLAKQHGLGGGSCPQIARTGAPDP